MSPPSPDQPESHKILCLLAHDLLNKLSIITGQCDLLLTERMMLDPWTVERLRLIQSTAVSMAEAIQKRQCPINTGSETQAAKAH